MTLLLAAVLAGACAPAEQPQERPPVPEAASEVESVGHVHQGIDYIEFTVTELETARRFYSTAFGWEFNDYGPDYAGIRGLGREVGGLRLQAEVTVGGPLVILYSADLDATLAAVRAAGGTIVTEPFDFPGGRRFHFLDPSGNELAVWGEGAQPE
jgi:predicted enzyme related to lactoylglutathione lyase